MLCEECGLKEATIHLTKVVGNQKTERHLCADCAREKGELNFVINPHLSMTTILSGMLKHTQKNVEKSANKPADRCEVCGNDYADFAKNGRLGCSECYARFETRLDPVLRRIHGAVEHTGKIPKRRLPEVTRKKEVESLRKRLEASVKAEAYEEAARLRDLIREVESEQGVR